MSIVNYIRATLDTHLSGISGLPVIANQNIKYTPAEDTPFIRTNFTPTSIRPAIMGLRPQQRYQGLYTALICTPQGNGSGMGYDYADLILQNTNVSDDLVFTPPSDAILLENSDILLNEAGDSLLLDAKIYVTVSSAEVGASYLDTPFYCTPVVINWYTYH